MNFRFLLPQQSHFFDYLNEQVTHLKEMTRLFYNFSREFNNFAKYSGQAKAIEHRADEATHKILAALNRDFLTPFDREDIHAIAREMDSVVDLLEDVIHNVYIYQVTIKLDVIEDFGRVILEAGDKLAELVKQLSEQKYTEQTRILMERVYDLEHEGDRLFEQAIGDLFKNDLDPIEIIKWKDICENMEVVTDECRTVANIIEGVMIKSS